MSWTTQCCLLVKQWHPASAKKEAEEEEPELPESKPITQPTKPLKGGLRRRSGGEQFGLKW